MNCLSLQVEEIDEKLLSLLSSQATGDLCPMQAVIGSMAAQEVMKVEPFVFTFFDRISLSFILGF